MNPLTRWRVRRMLRQGEEARALRLAGEGSLETLGRLGMHLSVVERAEEARGPRDRAAVAIARASLGHGLDRPDLAAMRTSERRRLAGGIASWSPRESLDLLPETDASARAAVLIALGETGRADAILQGIPRQGSESHALHAALAARSGDHSGARQALNALFGELDVARPLDAASDAPITLDALATEGGRPGSGAQVSVIMPAHNAAATIATAMASVLGQSWRSLELLVVDDASTDATAELVARVADPRLRLLRQPVQAGAYAARNRGLREATGEFVAINDADDWSHPERIARAVGQLSGRPGIANLSHLVRLDERGQLRSPRIFPLLRLNPASLVMRRANALDLGGFEEVRAGADMEFIARIVLRHGAAALQRDRAPMSVASLRTGSLTWGSDTGVDRREGVESRTRYREAWLRRHAGARHGIALQPR